MANYGIGNMGGSFRDAIQQMLRPVAPPAPGAPMASAAVPLPVPQGTAPPILPQGQFAMGAGPGRIPQMGGQFAMPVGPNTTLQASGGYMGPNDYAARLGLTRGF